MKTDGRFPGKALEDSGGMEPGEGHPETSHWLVVEGKVSPIHNLLEGFDG